MTFIPREPRFSGRFKIGEACTVKWYEMSAHPAPIPETVRSAARRQVREALEGTVDGPVGFAILHTGVDAVWLMSDTWSHDILHHRLWRAELSRPTDFTVVTAGGPTACVHELVVISHERDAYVEHVLDADPPDLAGYLDDVHGATAHLRRQALLDFDRAWRVGDVDALMELMSDEPSYCASTGPGPGQAHCGRSAVRAAFAAVIRDEAASGGVPTPSPALREDQIWLDGDRALTPWQYAARDPEGRPATVHGVDLWEFDGFRLRSKHAFRKAWDIRAP